MASKGRDPKKEAELDARIAALRKKNEELVRRQQAAEAEAARDKELDRLAAERARQQRQKEREQERERKAMEAYEAKRKQNIAEEKERQALIADYEQQREGAEKNRVVNQSLRGRHNAERERGPSRRGHARKTGGAMSAKERRWKEERAKIDAERMSRQMRVDEHGNKTWARAWDQPSHKVEADS
ncbi:hypothetical protein PTSG_03770 [Salpingoeca rosetta]|uniref:Uncharacterized protein n=1 Tax=Salpingoeca rosetta (strain ATCC 50818 / BSB-021) TaxID=946362 RepID=F2U5B8_SALR5|nr:uncharacterized protein PTSG_03770 [Salpingoeca rosetta]EGD83134.1 hypothetical protein PTSG_03770 [Salpingoeca rosetta]|eukprot:XP_004995498.1 hypothetical protein PTSG_03770 [Salpingoeca rosetta]